MNSKLHGHYHESLTHVSKHDRKMIPVLKDLIRINKDRITIYEKAAHEDNELDPEVRKIIYSMATDSRSYVNELHAEVIRMGAPPVTQETISGKIYLFWLDMKTDIGDFPGVKDMSAFPGPNTSSPAAKDVSSLWKACDRVEEAVQKAYRHALDGGDLIEDIYRLVEKQMWALEWTQGQMHNLNHTKYDQSNRP